MIKKYIYLTYLQMSFICVDYMFLSSCVYIIPQKTNTQSLWRPRSCSNVSRAPNGVCVFVMQVGNWESAGGRGASLNALYHPAVPFAKCDQ